MASRLPLIVLLLVVLIGCRPATPPPTFTAETVDPGQTVDASTAGPVRSTSLPEEALEIRNAEYQPGASETLQFVQLTDGRFEQGTPGSADYMSIAITDFVALGDLTADGTDEVAALISENYGGTGVFVFLAVYSGGKGAWSFQTSTMVDDRPQIGALSIADNEIFLDAVIHAIDEPMCCPTLRTTRHYRLVEGQLDLIDYTTFTPDGRPRTITIESPTEGTEVFTSVPIKGSVAIAPFENNLVYRIVDVSGIELSAGAITVSGADPGAPATFDAIIPIGRALSGAIIRLEVQDVSAADGSLLAMDSVELVVK